jgi:NAD(P)-dependent dehydrogenase (short-subunit alcohol dehydrogenase family)
MSAAALRMVCDGALAPAAGPGADHHLPASKRRRSEPPMPRWSSSMMSRVDRAPNHEVTRIACLPVMVASWPANLEKRSADPEGDDWPQDLPLCRGSCTAIARIVIRFPGLMAMPGHDNPFSRRQIVGSAGLGLAAIAAVAPAAAQDSTAATPKALQDPTTKYPRPPYPRQSQPWPGLAGKMDPKPDHGETSYKGSGRLVGRKALITGGDSGMGRATAIAYAREGADVAINYLPAEEPDAREVVDLIRASGRKAVPLPGDLRDAAFCRRLVSDAISQLGGLDIIVSNAGRQQSRASILEVSDEDFDATMKTNIYAPFYIIKAALPNLKPGSAIIATTSEQAYDPSPDLYDYAQTKAATMNFVKSLAKQLGPKGIRVNGVAPGPIWTPLQVSGGASEGKVVTFGATAPLGRAGQPAELAGIYVRLAEDDGSYTTGNVYGAGGGQGQP